MILAIDPGTEESAWCVLDAAGHPTHWGKERHGRILDILRGVVTDPLEFGPSTHELAVEMVASYGMPVGKEVFATVLWIGRYIEAWASCGGRYRLVYRRDVKLYHCQSVRANDANIRAALIDRFGPGRESAVGTRLKPGPLYGIKGDEWSALAIALTVHGAQSENALQAMQAAV